MYLILFLDNAHSSFLSQLRYNVLQYVPKEVEELYNYLQVEFNPLLLCKRVVPILESLDGNDSLSQYVAALKEVTLVRLIKQVHVGVHLLCIVKL